MCSQYNSYVEPIVGRYVHVELGGRHNRIYFEENEGADEAAAKRNG